MILLSGWIFRFHFHWVFLCFFRPLSFFSFPNKVYAWNAASLLTFLLKINDIIFLTVIVNITQLMTEGELWKCKANYRNTFWRNRWNLSCLLKGESFKINESTRSVSANTSLLQMYQCYIYSVQGVHSRLSERVSTCNYFHTFSSFFS